MTGEHVKPSPPPMLRHQGVILRPLDVDRDAAALHAVFGDAAAMRFMLGAPKASEQATRALLHAWSEDTSSPQWVILETTGISGVAVATAAADSVDVTHGTALGRITLVARRKGVMEIGVQTTPEHQGKGLARRAIAAVTAYGLRVLGLVRVYADVDPENTPCVRVFQRAGFLLEGRLVSNWVAHTGVVDSLIFAATTRGGWSSCENDGHCSGKNEVVLRPPHETAAL